MYRILIIDTNIQNIQLKNKVKYIKLKEAIKELKTSEYDLIFLKDKVESLEKIILADYMQLPKELKKLAINNEENHTYISLQIVNKLIIDNLKIIEFKDFYEEMAIALILKQFLIGETNLEKTYNNICPKEQNEKEIRKTVEKVVRRSYSAKKIIRKCKYYMCHKRIKVKFFENIFVNIKNDINNMENL